MHATYPENVQEHSLRVALVAHMLAVIRNRRFGGDVNPERVATLALYHDVGEILTGDLPTPVKHANPDMHTAYRALEDAAVHRLFAMLPAQLQDDYRAFFARDPADRAHHELVDAADKLCAYMKCLEEVSAGNREFARAERTIEDTVARIALPEVRYFVDTFIPSFRLTLDDLN